MGLVYNENQRKNERMISLYELRVMRANKIHRSKCCSGCDWFRERLGIDFKVLVMIGT